MDRPPGTLRATVADNVRRLRKSKGLSQEGLADLCGLHRTYIGSIERAERNVSLGSLERMSSALGVETWALLKGG